MKTILLTVLSFGLVCGQNASHCPYGRSPQGIGDTSAYRIKSFPMACSKEVKNCRTALILLLDAADGHLICFDKVVIPVKNPSYSSVKYRHDPKGKDKQGKELKEYVSSDKGLQFLFNKEVLDLQYKMYSAKK